MSSSTLAFPGIDAAIASVEGYGQPGTLATVNNNPGNIIAGNYATAQGATGTNNGFAVFPNAATGMQAEDNLVQNYANQPGETIQDLINSWAPGTQPGNNPGAYASTVATDVGTTPGASLASQAGVTGTSTGASSTSPSAFSNLLNAFTGGATSAASNAFGLSWSRVAAFVLGLILVAAGLYLLKPTQQIISSAKNLGVAAL